MKTKGDTHIYDDFDLGLLTDK